MRLRLSRSAGVDASSTRSAEHAGRGEVELHARSELLGAAAAHARFGCEDRQVIRKLDGVSVHTMRFGDAGIPDEAKSTRSVRPTICADGSTW
jgi:hypothetical protein